MRGVILLLLICCCNASVLAQRNCAFDSTGLTPLTDLQGKQWRGHNGGLYYNGLNSRPADHKSKALLQAAAVQPLDLNGSPSAFGKIVFIGVGASNPRTEFIRFSTQIENMSTKNPALKLINTCIGGQGIQKMNIVTDTYWRQAEKQLADSGLSAKQVQVAWIETDNTQTADTTFPHAPESLRDEFRTLLQTMRSLYPNIKLCFITARAYSGFVDLDAGATVGRGLLYPRDYYNGWAIKMLIEKQMSGDASYAFEGPSDPLLFATWGSYHWTDGSRQRSDGFAVQCSTDVGADGLHLSEAGEIKMGNLMFQYFTNDESAKPWLYAPSTNSASDSDDRQPSLCVFPQPASEMLTIQNLGGASAVQVTDIYGSVVWEHSASELHTISTRSWASGVYLLRTAVSSRLFSVHH